MSERTIIRLGDQHIPLYLLCAHPYLTTNSADQARVFVSRDHAHATMVELALQRGMTSTAIDAPPLDGPRGFRINGGTESFEAIEVGDRIAALANDQGSWDGTETAEEFTGLVDLALTLRDYCTADNLHLSQLTLVAEHSVPEWVAKYNDGCDDPTDRTTVERFLAENEDVIEFDCTAFLVVVS